MAARSILKSGPTRTLRPVAPSFAVDQSVEPTGLKILGETEDIQRQPFVFLRNDSNFFDNTDKTTGFLAFSRGYISVSAGLALQGFLWAPDAVFENGFAQMLTPQTFVNSVDLVQSEGTEFGPFGTNFVFTFVDNVPFTAGLQSITVPDRVLTYNLNTAEGWAERVTTELSATGIIAQFGDGVEDGAMNIIYNTTDNPDAFSCISINRLGAPTYHTAFSYAAIDYDLSIGSDNSRYIHTTLDPDGSFWTYWEIFVNGVAPDYFSTIRLVNWGKTGYQSAPIEAPYDGLALSDAADQSDLDAALALGLGTETDQTRLMGDRVVIALNAMSDTDQDFLVFSSDWTTYERFNMRDGAGSDDRPSGLGAFRCQQLFRDRDDNYFGIRGSKAVYRLYLNGNPSLGPPFSGGGGSVRRFSTVLS